MHFIAREQIESCIASHHGEVKMIPLLKHQHWSIYKWNQINQT